MRRDESLESGPKTPACLPKQLSLTSHRALPRSFTFDLLFALAIFMTSPVVVSISAALVIPLSFIADYLLHGSAVNAVSVGGSGVVLAGLYVLNCDDFVERLKRKVSGGEPKLDPIPGSPAPGTPETSLERSGSGGLEAAMV